MFNHNPIHRHAHGLFLCETRKLFGTRKIGCGRAASVAEETPEIMRYLRGRNSDGPEKALQNPIETTCETHSPPNIPRENNEKSGPCDNKVDPASAKE